MDDGWIHRRRGDQTFQGEKRINTVQFGLLMSLNRVMNRLRWAGSMLAENPALLMKLGARRVQGRAVPRAVWLRRLQRDPVRRMGLVLFDTQQRCSRCERDIAALYEASRFDRSCTTCGKSGTELRTCAHILDVAIRSTYFRACELDVEDVMIRTLRPGDVFLDIGAQLGYFTALGANLVGSVGQVPSCEPIPWLADVLCRVGSLNRQPTTIFA